MYETGNTFTAEAKLLGYDRKYYVCSYISNGRQERKKDGHKAILFLYDVTIG